MMKAQKTGLDLPTSGQILEKIVAALNIRDEILTSRTTKRYLSGETISQHSESEIYLALGSALVRDRPIPAPPILAQKGLNFGDTIGIACARICIKWDSLRSKMQTESALILEPEHAVNKFMRLVAVDFSLRLFALFRLCELEPPRPHTPQWSLENGFGLKLRQLIAECGLTRDQLAARLDMSHRSVDNWLDGKTRPTTGNVAKIAGVIAKFDKAYSESDLYAELHRYYSLSYLSDLLTNVIGREAVREIAAALYRFTYTLAEDTRRMGSPPIEETANIEFDTFRLGMDYPGAYFLVRHLEMSEQDTEWKKDILSASEPWEVAFQLIANESGQGRFAAGLAQDISDLPDANPNTGPAESPSPNDPVSKEIRDLATNHLETVRRRIMHDDPMKIGNPVTVIQGMVDDIYLQISALRRIAQRYPTNAQAHFEFGSLLGWAGSKIFGDRSMIDEAITECKIAATLREEWDLPLVEPAVILSNTGYYEEALKELEWAESKLPAKTPHLSYGYGYVLMMLSRFSEALDEFKFVLAHRPDYAIALNDAAHCAFMLGDTKDGMRYAKEARKFGERQTYQAWRAGQYSKS